ncbi:hypothetical protein O181_059368 [Austropuccinia psidii MF-1]|uniref:Myotubularin phosphatase domain-containing protein n=1 Tax=Austropuccinia psidii MF-1 TaxID=1389203 RepID=A0A9Q3HWG1_9BASI|nr:hypothetical protein [Austropuccinia psidii MF-1]
MEAIKVAKVDFVKLKKLSHRTSPSNLDHPSNLNLSSQLGSLLITPHHLIWSSTQSFQSRKNFHDSEKESPTSHLKSIQVNTASFPNQAGEIWIAHSLLTAVEHLSTFRQPTILIRLATFVTYTLSFNSHSALDDVWDSIKALVSNRKPGEKDSLYAFVCGATSSSSKSSPVVSSPLPGWDTYQPEKEFKRMKVLNDSSNNSENSAWRLTTTNQDFKFCSTYPSLLLVPSKISDTTLTYAVKYRSKGRLPVGTYVHWANGSSITRSSQPMVGFKNARSIQDEKLIEAIFHSHALHTGPRTPLNESFSSSPLTQSPKHFIYGATSSNLIIDARPTTNAVANTVKGAGTENMDYYKGCRKAYLGIDNIHVMRDSLNKVVSAIHESFVTGNLVSVEALKRSGWLKHIGAILEGTSLITRTVHVFTSHVLIHCSDGWDRTSQLSALSQVCLDPFYRTFNGFAILIEKDWLSFGHKFSDRSGIVIPGRERVSFGDSPTYSNHLTNPTVSSEEPESTSSSGAWVTSFQKQLSFGSSHAFKETSPVFHQFLDCVYQLQRQFPKRFEFNSHYLERLHEELHASNYGTFLFDSEKERTESKASFLTRSVWELFSPSTDVTEYRNPQYDSSLDDPTDRSNTDQGVLYPDVKDVVFWWELFGCDNEAMNPPKQADSNINSDFTHITSPAPEPIENSAHQNSSNSRSPQVKTLADLHNHAPEIPFGSEKMDTDHFEIPTDITSYNNSEYQSYSHSTLAGEQIQNAFQTAKTMGWSTWDRLKKGYEEVARSSTSSSSASKLRYQPSPSLSTSPTCRPQPATMFSPKQSYPIGSEINPWSNPDLDSSNSLTKGISTFKKQPAHGPHPSISVSLPAENPWQPTADSIVTLEQTQSPCTSNFSLSINSISSKKLHINNNSDKLVDGFTISGNKSPTNLTSNTNFSKVQIPDIDPLGVGLN